MDETTAKEHLASLKPADIMQVYSGRPGCACGCNGEYRITAESRAEADESRGYPHGDTDVNPRQVSRVLKLVQKHAASDGYNTCEADYIEDLDSPDRGEVFWNAADDLQYITYQASDRRVYTVYLTSAARRARGIEKGYDLQ